jgi:hypothetical protein
MKIKISIIFIFLSVSLFGQYAGGRGKGDASAALPLLFCPNNIVVNTSTNGSGDCLGTVAWTHPALPADLVAPVTFTMTINDGTPASVTPATVISQSWSPGTYTIAYQLEDAEGYQLTCSFEVQVVDNELPVLNCIPELTLALNGQPSVMLNIADFASPTDNCAIVSTTFMPTTVSQAQLGQTIPVQIVVADAAGNMSACTTQLSINDLPPGWSHSSGSVGDCNSEMRYETGSGIWTGNAINCTNGSPFQQDKQLFAKRQLCGDGSITAQVTGLSGGAGFAGIAMRESTATGSRKVQMSINRVSNIVRREIRTTTNGQAFPSDFSSPCERSWLRIVRTGNVFRGYTSMDGITWWYVMQVLVPMNACIDVGLILQNMQAASTCQATFAQVSTTGGSPAPAIQYAGIEESLSGDITVFPNPSGGQFSLDLGSYAGEDLELVIQNSQGQPVWVRTINNAPVLIDDINLKQIPAGIYQLSVRTSTQTAATRRIVIH